MKRFSPHFIAVWQALFVTFLWSTSWVLIKFGLVDIPALTFAGLRYGLAFLCLLPFTFRPAYLTTLRTLTLRDWLRLIGLGLIFYAVTQGAQFLGLAYLPANTVNLLLNFTPAVVTLLGISLLAELPTPFQWLGVGLSLAGAVIYFYPAALPGDQIFGLSVVLVGVLANAGSAVLGRHINRAGHLSPLFVTLVSMCIGSMARSRTRMRPIPSSSPLEHARRALAAAPPLPCQAPRPLPPPIPRPGSLPKQSHPRRLLPARPRDRFPLGNDSGTTRLPSQPLL
jgi:drug/metabolite transporter (DMT)-like permease